MISNVLLACAVGLAPLHLDLTPTPQMPQGLVQVQGSPSSLPSGGTPEPTMAFLLGGGALAYYGLRRKKRKAGDDDQ